MPNDKSLQMGGIKDIDIDGLYAPCESNMCLIGYSLYYRIHLFDTRDIYVYVIDETIRRHLILDYFKSRVEYWSYYCADALEACRRNQICKPS